MKVKQLLTLVFILSIGLNLYSFLQPKEERKIYRLEGDTRTEIYVKPEHKEFVLNEMREFVEGLHLISQGIANNEPEKIIEAAKRSGTSVKAPKELVQSMPKSFMQMGQPTHQLFDTMADSARINFNPETAQKQLVELTNRCVNCHSTYRLEANF